MFDGGLLGTKYFVQNRYFGVPKVAGYAKVVWPNASGD